MVCTLKFREGYVTQLRLKKVAEGRKIENVIARKPDAEIRSEVYVGMAGHAEGDAESNIFRMLTDQYVLATTAAEFAPRMPRG